MEKGRGSWIRVAALGLVVMSSAVKEVQALDQAQFGDHFELQMDGQVFRQVEPGIFEHVYLPSHPIKIKLMYTNVQGPQDFLSGFTATLDVRPIQGGAVAYSTSFRLVNHNALDLSTQTVGYTEIPANTLSPGQYLMDVTARINGQFLATPSAIIEVAGGTTTERPAETPWGTNAYGEETYGMVYRYTMGYRFIPQIDGKITKLGGLFHGTKTVYLYDATGSILALASVIGNTGNSKAWKYASITPVSVRKDQTYTVAVALVGSGGSIRDLSKVVIQNGGLHRTPNPLPKTFGGVKIVSSVYASDPQGTGAMPRSNETNYMYGQADIEFVPTGQ
ncbi:MAG: DUF4082 domain-containing protein [Candidatus Omnitrophica bacterium]|nr:DUF4082 domain-containing protein [Candidatus Omnitrophota bacterium]